MRVYQPACGFLARKIGSGFYAPCGRRGFRSVGMGRSVLGSGLLDMYGWVLIG